MKRIPLILSLALLLLLPAIALYPILHASAEKDGVDSSTAIQEADMEAILRRCAN